MTTVLLGDNMFVTDCKVQLKEKLLQDLLCGNQFDREELAQRCELLNIDQDIYYFVVIGKVCKAKGKQNFLPCLIETCSDLKGSVLLCDSKGCYVALIPKDATEDIAFTCNILKDNFEQHTGLGITLAIGGAPQALAELYKAYERASKAMEYKYFLGGNRVISYEDVVKKTVDEQNIVDMVSIQAQLLQAVRSSEEQNISTLCEAWLPILNHCSYEMVQSAFLQLMGSLAGELIEAETSFAELFGEKGKRLEDLVCFDTIFEAKEGIEKMLLCISDYLGEKNQKRSRKLAKKAAQYIDEHYTEKITIDAVANAVYLSAGYLMTIFKREMGISIVSYLTTKRMDMAKKMLRESDTRICEVAEKVGYANATFFSTTFRSSTGMSPKQYRKSIKEESNDNTQFD